MKSIDSDTTAVATRLNGNAHLDDDDDSLVNDENHHHQHQHHHNHRHDMINNGDELENEQDMVDDTDNDSMSDKLASLTNTTDCSANINSSLSNRRKQNKPVR